MNKTTFTANEFKNGKWINSYEVSGIKELREIVAVCKKYGTGPKTPDCWNMESNSGTVLEVVT